MVETYLRIPSDPLVMRLIERAHELAEGDSVDSVHFLRACIEADPAVAEKLAQYGLSCVELTRIATQTFPPTTNLDPSRTRSFLAIVRMINAHVEMCEGIPFTIIDLTIFALNANSATLEGLLSQSQDYVDLISTEVGELIAA